MSRHEHENLAGELPRSHDYQTVLMVVFFAIWILDSFLLRLTTLPTTLLTALLPLVPALPLLGVAVYFLRASHRDLFDTQIDGLATGGVFSRVRHPMYLGTVLFYLGLAVGTLSIASLIFWLVIFAFYNMLASYEERLLRDRFGEQFLVYTKSVRKWIPT
jgi:protein-S-isoprenylcysteine O-methyltransferase Ste14